MAAPFSPDHVIDGGNRERLCLKQCIGCSHPTRSGMFGNQHVSICSASTFERRRQQNRTPKLAYPLKMTPNRLTHWKMTLRKSGGLLSFGLCTLVLRSLWVQNTLYTDDGGINRESLVATSTSPQLVPQIVPHEVGFQLLKTRSSTWEVFDKSSDTPLFHDGGYECDWRNYTSPISGKQSPMCLSPPFERISDSIRNDHHWSDCLALTRLYEKGIDQKIMPVHLEIGANIGACMVEILLADDNVHVIAFEPFPANLFRLTSTALKNPDFHRRVTVFPVALGQTQTSMKMILERPNNFGSARIFSKPDVKPETRGKPTEPVTIPIERLDDLVAVPPEEKRYISSIKMDAQGYECYVLDGMPRLVSRVARLLTEVEMAILSDFEGCSKDLLLDRLRKADFTLLQYKGTGHFKPLPDEIKRDQNVLALRGSLLKS
mmetsp:Transcript_17738/g.30128  ORF Transcript_17738/g.30128 Transcript_17738/m.30128 type:complete len:432 (+) Transcript_17738:1046-2341(+)